MELRVYDQDINELGIIDVFKSLIWTKRFYETGVFELQLPLTENNVSLIAKNRYIQRADAETEAALITSITDRDQDGEKFMIVSGVMLGGLLDKRNIFDTYSSRLSSTLGMYLCDSKGEIFNYVGVPLKYTGLEVDVAFEDDVEDDLTESSFGKNLGEYARNLLRVEEKGLKLEFRPDEKKILLKFVKGVDRSAEQSENPHIIFSEVDGNLYNTTYNYSEEGCCSLVFCSAFWDDDVVSPGFNDPSTRACFYGRSHSGGEEISGVEITTAYARTEAVIDVISTQTGTIKVVNKPKTQAKLMALCKQMYSPYTENYEGTAIGDGYRTEWQLGDHITVEDSKRGALYKKQIEEVTEIFEGNSKTVNVVFGSDLKTIVDLAKGGR